MIKTKELGEKGFYIFESRVCAKNNYIENLSEAKMLLSYLNYYLKDYLKIYDYVINRHGFQLAVKLNAKGEILESYRRERNSKNKLIEKDQIWRIISERVRLCLSTYVKRINKKRGRTGVLVHSSYLKYFFVTLKEAKHHLNLMRNQLVKFYQRKKKYRGLKKHYRISQKIARGSIFLCSKEVSTGEKLLRKTFNNKWVWEFPDLVVQELVNYTKCLHPSSPLHNINQNGP